MYLTDKAKKETRDRVMMLIEDYENRAEQAEQRERDKGKVCKNEEREMVKNAIDKRNCRETALRHKRDSVKEAFLHEAIAKIVRESCSAVSPRKDSIIDSLVCDFIANEGGTEAILRRFSHSTQFLKEVSVVVNQNSEKFFKRALATTNRVIKKDKDGYPTIQGLTQEELYPSVTVDPLLPVKEGVGTERFFEKAYATTNGRRKIKLNSDGYPTVSGDQDDYTLSNKRKAQSLLEGKGLKEIEDTPDVVLDKNGYPTLDGQSRVDFYKDLDSKDIDSIVDIIRSRVNQDVEHFVTSNISDREKIKDALTQTQEKINKIRAKDEDKEQELKESYENMCSQYITNVRYGREKGILENLVINISESAYKDPNMKAIYNNKDGVTLDMDSIVEDATVMYTFLETVNTLMMTKVDKEYIKDFLSSVK